MEKCPRSANILVEKKIEIGKCAKRYSKRLENIGPKTWRLIMLEKKDLFPSRNPKDVASFKLEKFLD